MRNTVIAAVVMAAGCALAAPANAYPFTGPKGDNDDAAYWVDTSAYNRGSKPVSKAEAGEIGRYICHQLESGHSEGDVIASVATDTSDVNADTFIVDAAEWHYCPSYY